MRITESNRQLWLDLYKAAETFKKLKPWGWMYDSDLFGLQDPDTGEYGFCCVMGNAGQVYALAVYTGVDGLASYWDIADGDTDDPVSAGLNQKCLMVSFENREMLSKKDREQLKELGIKYRGKNQWIQFRDYSPGLYPWYISNEQAQFLLHALQQTMDVAIRFEENEALIHKDEVSYLMRKPQKTANGIEWKDTYIAEEDLEEELMEQEEEKIPNPFSIRRLKDELSQRKGAILFSISYMRQTIQEDKKNRPYFPKLALWISYPSYFIIGQKMFSPESIEAFEDYFFESLHQIRYIPGQIVVVNEMTYNLVEPYAEALGIELIYAPDEQGFKEVFDSLSKFL